MLCEVTKEHAIAAYMEAVAWYNSVVHYAVDRDLPDHIEELETGEYFVTPAGAFCTYTRIDNSWVVEFPDGEAVLVARNTKPLIALAEQELDLFEISG